MICYLDQNTFWIKQRGTYQIKLTRQAHIDVIFEKNILLLKQTERTKKDIKINRQISKCKFVINKYIISE